MIVPYQVAESDLPSRGKQLLPPRRLAAAARTTSTSAYILYIPRLNLNSLFTFSLHQFLNGWMQGIDAYTNVPRLGQYFNLDTCGSTW